MIRVRQDDLRPGRRRSWSGSNPLTVPCVPTGMNAGVSKAPCSRRHAPEPRVHVRRIGTNEFVSKRNLRHRTRECTAFGAFLAARDVADRATRVSRSATPQAANPSPTVLPTTIASPAIASPAGAFTVSAVAFGIVLPLLCDRVPVADAAVALSVCAFPRLALCARA